MDLVEQVLQARIEELEQQITEANSAYYVDDEPIVSNDVYDAWRDELVELKSESTAVTSVGAPVSGERPKVLHTIPMGSQEKVNTPEEFLAWVAKTGATHFTTTEKLDGASVSVEYEDDKYARATGRGDGIEGEDLTENVRRMKGVPAELPGVGSLTLRGEIMLLLSDFKTHFPDKKAARNTASGTSRRDDGHGCEHLTVFFYQVADGADFKTKAEQFDFLVELGLTVPSRVTGDAESVLSLREAYQDNLRDELDYEIDGLIVEVDDLEAQLVLGDKHMRPEGSRAFKFAELKRETTLRSFEKSVKASGRITPVAHFDAVTLLSVTVTQASVYNYSYIKKLQLGVGAKVLVARANDVIPRVTDLVKAGPNVEQPPTQCPVCGTATEREGEYVVCPNRAACPAQAAGRVERWIKTLNILGWGESIIKRLVESGLVKSPADLYRLSQDALANVDGLGQGSAVNLRRTLWDGVEMTLPSFLGSLSIPLCSRSTIEKCMDSGIESLEDFKAATLDQFMAVDGLGERKASNLSAFLLVHWSLIDELLEVGIKIKGPVKGVLTSKKIVFTSGAKGAKSLHKRAEWTEMVQANGGTVKGNVGKDTDFLVMASFDATTTKAKAAAKNGTKCLSEEDFLKMING